MPWARRDARDAPRCASPSSARGLDSWRAAARWPATAAWRMVAGSARPAAIAPNQPTRNPIECVAGPGRVGCRLRLRRHLEAEALGSVPAITVAPFAPRFTHRAGRELEQPLDAVPAEQYTSASAAVANRRSGAASLTAAVRPAGHDQGGPIDARSRLTNEPAAAEFDRASASAAKRLAEPASRPGRGGVDSGEPRRVKVIGMEPVGSGAVGHERPLAAGRDDDTDPPGTDARHANGAHADLVAADRLDERPSGGVAPDRRHERGLRPEPAQPAGGRRREPTLRTTPNRARRCRTQRARTAGRRRASGRRPRRSVGPRAGGGLGGAAAGRARTEDSQRLQPFRHIFRHTGGRHGRGGSTMQPSRTSGSVLPRSPSQ